MVSARALSYSVLKQAQTSEDFMACLETQSKVASARSHRVPVAIMFGLAILILAMVLRSFVSLETFLVVRDRFHLLLAQHYILAIVVYYLVYTAVVSLSLPGAILFSVVSGALFGWVGGAFVSAFAATTGASVVFWLARTACAELMAERAGSQIARFRAGFCEHALSYMLFLRLVPAFPFFVVNIVPALIGVPFRTYLLGTLLGILPASFAYSSAGAGLDTAIQAAQAAQVRCLVHGSTQECPLSLKLSNLITPELTLAFMLLSVLALVPVGVKIWRRRRGDNLDQAN